MVMVVEDRGRKILLLGAITWLFDSPLLGELMPQGIEEVSGRIGIVVRTAWGTEMHGILVQIHALEGGLVSSY